MRSFLDIAGWSTLILVILSAFLSPAQQPAAAPPAPAPAPVADSQAKELAALRARNQELLQLLNQSHSRRDQLFTETQHLRTAVDAAVKESAQLRQQVSLLLASYVCPTCGPGCKCAPGKCKCRWPGECQGKPKPKKAPQVADIQWLSSIAAAKTEAARTGLPALLHFYTDSCIWCQRMDKEVFTKPEIREYIAANFVAARINANWLTPEEKRVWAISAVPAEYVVRADWRKAKSNPTSTNPARYRQNLEATLEWMVNNAVERSVIEPHKSSSYLPSYRTPVYRVPIYSGSAAIPWGGPTHQGGWGGGPGVMSFGGGGGCSSCGP